MRPAALWMGAAIVSANLATILASPKIEETRTFSLLNFAFALAAFVVTLSNMSNSDIAVSPLQPSRRWRPRAPAAHHQLTLCFVQRWSLQMWRKLFAFVICYTSCMQSLVIEGA